MRRAASRRYERDGIGEVKNREQKMIGRSITWRGRDDIHHQGMGLA